MHLLETRNLVKEYGGRRVVNGVSINVRRGEVVGLLGPNGAGKTTTFYMITGIIRPDKGHTIFDKKDIIPCLFALIKESISLVTFPFFASINNSLFSRLKRMPCLLNFSISFNILSLFLIF